MAQNQHSVPARYQVFFRTERTAQLRLDSQNFQQIARYDGAQFHLRQRVALVSDAERGVRESHQPVKAFALIAEIDVVAVRGHDPGETAGGLNHPHGHHFAWAQNG